MPEARRQPRRWPGARCGVEPHESVETEASEVRRSPHRRVQYANTRELRQSHEYCAVGPTIEEGTLRYGQHRGGQHRHAHQRQNQRKHRERRGASEMRTGTDSWELSLGGDRGMPGMGLKRRLVGEEGVKKVWHACIHVLSRLTDAFRQLIRRDVAVLRRERPGGAKVGSP
jgi:hypothetical protein